MLRELVSLALALAPKVACGLVLVVFLRQKELAGNRVFSLKLVLLLLLADVVLYPRFGAATGSLKLSVGGYPLDLATLAAGAALVARLSVGPTGLRVRPAALWWGAFLVWTAAAAVRGVLVAHPTNLVGYEALVVPHIALVAWLAAGVPPRQLYAALPGMVETAAVVGAAVSCAQLVGKYWLLPGPTHGALLGVVGADAATVFASAGVAALVLALSERETRRRARLALAGGICIVVTLTVGQRASLLGLVVALLVAGCLALVQRDGLVRLRPGEPTMMALCGVALFSGLVFFAAVQGSLPGASDVARAFNSVAKQESADSRLNQWSAAGALIEAAPVTGHGLGVTFTYLEVGPNQQRQSDITHDVPLDVFMRTGIVGLLFLVLALTTSVADGVWVARRSRDRARVAVATFATAAIVGLMARGLVESVFEKHRLAVLLGALLGVLYSTSANHDHLGGGNGARVPAVAGIDEEG